jgi:hypothetical protein
MVAMVATEEAMEAMEAMEALAGFCFFEMNIKRRDSLETIRNPSEAFIFAAHTHMYLYISAVASACFSPRGVGV